VEDARSKIAVAIDLLDVQAAGSLHDAVQMIIQAMDAKSSSGAAAPGPAS
jgi:hypothetical protein